MFGFIGLLEVVVILFVILALFGNRLPGACRAIGRSIVEFKKGLKGSETHEDK